MKGITEVRRIELLRLNEERRGDVLYDMSRLKIELGRLERRLIEIEDAMQDLAAGNVADSGFYGE